MDLRCLESWYGSYLLCVSLKQKPLELAFYCLIEWVVFYEYWGNSYLESNGIHSSGDVSIYSTWNW